MGDGGEKFGQRVVILQAPAIYGFQNLPDLDCLLNSKGDGECGADDVIG